MPYKVFKQDDEWCVFKLDSNDEKTGSSLGCHSTEDEANKQIIAIEISEGEMNEDEQARSLFDNFWQGLKGIFGEKIDANEEQSNEIQRALGMHTIDDQVMSLIMELYPDAMYHQYYVDDDNQIYALLSKNNILYRSLLTIQDGQIEMGEWEAVTQEFEPVQTRTIIRQQENGQYRWISRSATAVINRVNQIDSTRLFDSFIEHIERTDEYPIRQFMHQGEEFKTGQADFVTRDGYILITSGIYDDTEIANIEIKARQNNPDYWGESIGYKATSGEKIVLRGGIEIPVYTQGVLKEISTTPEKMATNLFTSTEVTQRMLKDKVFETFVKLFTDAGLDAEKAEEWLEENVDRVNQRIDEAGLITRSEEDERKKGEEQNTEELEAQKEDNDLEIDDNVIEAVVTRMQEVENEEIIKLRSLIEEMTKINEGFTDNISQIAASLSDIHTRLDVLEIDENEKKRQYQEDLPKTKIQRVKYNPRQAENGDLEDFNKIATERMPKNAY